MRTLILPLLFLLLSAVSFAQTPGSAPPPKVEECKVSGMVVRLAGSEPLRKARVRLQSADDRTRSTSVVTDASGRFQFKGVEPGRYKLLATRSGFVTQEYGQRKPDDPGALLTLRAGQEVKDLLFRLTVSAVIAGRVLDEDGEPLVSVNVSALREVYNEGKRTLATSSFASTNDLGEYRLFGLPPGRYFVTAVYPHWGRYGSDESDSDNADAQQGYAKMFYPGTPDAAKAMTILLKAGDEIPSVEILMRPVSVYRIRGHVFNLITGKTSTSINVMLMPKHSGREWDFSDQQALVDHKDGSFMISGVLPGSYLLLAMWFDQGSRFVTRLPIDVGSANIDDVTLTIATGVTLSGRLIWDGSPSLQDSELSVFLKPADTSFNFWGGNNARVDAANSFTLKDVNDGTYLAQTYGQSRDCYIKDVHYGSSDGLDDGFTVSRGAPASLQITLSSRGARVQGAVADADGLPAAGVQVVLIPERSRRTLYRLYKTATTDQYGHFEIRGIAPGDYKLFSWEQVEEGAWEDPEFLKPFEEKGQDVSFHDDDQKTLNLSAVRTKTPDSPAS